MDTIVPENGQAAENAPRDLAHAIQLLRFLAEGRKQYFHGEGGSYWAWSDTDRALHSEYRAMEYAAGVLEGSRGGAEGWLPSWLWDEYAALLKGGDA